MLENQYRVFEGIPSDIEKQSIKNIYEIKILDEIKSYNDSQDLPYENIFNIFDNYNVELGYISDEQINGRPVPHATIIDALETDDGKLVKSLDTDLDLDEMVDYAINLIDEHYRYYGSMFNQKVFSDAGDFNHFQSALLVPSYIKSRPPIYTPIIGVNALNIAIIRLRTQRNTTFPVGNVLSPKKYREEDTTLFTYDYLGYSPFSYEPNAAGIRDIHDRVYTHTNPDDFSAFGIVIKLDCLPKGSYPDYPSHLSEKPFRWIGIGYQDIPSNWSTILFNYYLGISEFSRSILTSVKYKDVFLFWLAASSGLPLSIFKSFENEISDYHAFSRDIKADIIRDMMPLVENASLNMQSDEYLRQTPLINLY